MDTEAGEVRFYYQEYRGFLAMAGLVHFELWSGEDMKWRLEGEITCSNGVPFCYLAVPMADGEDAIDVPVQDIWESGVAPQYMVFAQLFKTAYRRQVYEQKSLELTYESEPLAPDSYIELPSYYRFVSCGRQAEH